MMLTNARKDTRPVPSGAGKTYTMNNESALFSHRALWALIWPLMLEQLLTIMVGTVDSVMVASTGENAVSAVSLVDAINQMIIYILSALGTGGAVVISQYLGRREQEQAKRSAAQLYTVLGLASSVIMLLFLLLGNPILQVLYGNIETDVMQMAKIYMLFSVISYPFLGVYNAGAALFRAHGNSRTSMYTSLVMNLINVAGNALLIYGFGWGVLGAALATLAGRIFAAGYVFWQQQRDSTLRMDSLADLRPQSCLARRILAVGVPAGLENGIFHVGKLLISILVSTLGTTAIAANAVTGVLCSLTNVPGTAIGLGMVTVVGQCLGAGEKRQARRYTVELLAIAMFCMVVMNLVLFLFLPLLVGLYELSEQAATLAIQSLLVYIISSTLFWTTGFILPNALRSGGDAKFTMTISIASMWLCRVALAYVFVQKLDLSIPGVWLGMGVDFAVRSVFFIWRFLSGKWMEKTVI